MKVTLNRQIGYHLRILADGDLIDAQDITSMGHQANRFFINGITWNGHEFLDAVRDEGVWSNVKEVLKPVGAVSFEIIKGLAVAYLSKQVGLP